MNDKPKYDPNIHHRVSIRLKEYDYSQPGEYFVTICTKNRECLFGDVMNGKMILNEYGKIAQQFWVEIPNHYPNIELDEFIVMPNHLHGIIIISVGIQNFESLPKRNQFQHIIPKSIGSIIRGFKIGVTKWFRQNTEIYNVWQHNYYEHIIRNEKSLNEIREYIINNPINWEKDHNYR